MVIPIPSMFYAGGTGAVEAGMGSLVDEHALISLCA